MTFLNRLRKEKIEEATKELTQMEQDRLILRYRVVDAAEVNSPTLGFCRYIYPKLGMFDSIIPVSNIDFVREVYAKNGIVLQKHVSNLNNKKEEVLYITLEDIDKLSNAQKKFLDDTAPLPYRYHDDHYRTIGRRVTDILNEVYQVAHPEVVEILKAEGKGNR